MFTLTRFRFVVLQDGHVYTYLRDHAASRYVGVGLESVVRGAEEQPPKSAHGIR